MPFRNYTIALVVWYLSTNMGITRIILSDPESLSNLDESEVDLEQAEEPERPYFFQLDVLKAIAIAFVVMDHSLTWEIKGSLGSLFWERLSIPFFLIVMGFNMAYSFNYSGARTLRELYSKEYFKGKFVRYVLPFAVLYMGSILVGMYTGLLTFNEYTLLGTLPFWGPGNWFIALLFGSIVIFPFVYWLFKKQPMLTVVLCFLGEIMMQSIMFLWFPYPIDSALEGFIVTAIRLNIIFFLPAVGLGLWFSKGYSLTEKRNWFIYLYAPISLIFMIDYTTGILGSMPNTVGQIVTLIQDFIQGDYTLLFYGYAAFLFLLAMRYIPHTPTDSIQRFFQRVGRASYHILLFQIFYMSIVYLITSEYASIHHEIPDFAVAYSWSTELIYIPFYLMNLAICICGGLAWYEAEKRASVGEQPWWQHIWMKRMGFLFGAIMSIALMIVSLKIINEVMGINQFTSLGVMVNLLAILFFVGFCMVLICKAFTLDDDDIPI